MRRTRWMCSPFFSATKKPTDENHAARGKKRELEECAADDSKSSQEVAIRVTVICGPWFKAPLRIERVVWPLFGAGKERAWGPVGNPVHLPAAGGGCARYGVHRGARSSELDLSESRLRTKEPQVQYAYVIFSTHWLKSNIPDRVARRSGGSRSRDGETGQRGGT